MGRKEKLLARFLGRPKDFTFEELVKLLNGFGFYEAGTGRTGGSRVRFKKEGRPDHVVKFHRPHPENVVKPYVLDIVRNMLEECNLLTIDKGNGTGK